MMISSDQELILLKANLSTGLYLHITVDNPSIVMIQRRKRLLVWQSSSAKGGGRYERDHERDSSNFQLKVDIP